MTDETKKLFAAPYKVVETRNGYNVICTNKLIPQLCWTTGEKDANRLARLPELYDALVEALNLMCRYVHEPFMCKKCEHENYCLALKWDELLRKVRDGE